MLPQELPALLLLCSPEFQLQLLETRRQGRLLCIDLRIG